MKISKAVSMGVCAVIVAGLTFTSGDASANPIRGKERGHCRLINVDYGRDLYSGNCVIREKIDGNLTIYDIKIPGSDESFRFASSDGGRTWMHGPEPTRFRDRGHSAVFRWGSFRLEVEED